jgi:hypothetical protein
MKNRNKILIKLFAILFLITGIVMSFNTIVRYLTSPWLIGANYIPAYFTEPEMIGIFLNLSFGLLLIASSLMVLLGMKNAYNAFLLVLLVYAISVPVTYFIDYHHDYVLSELWFELLTHFITTGIAIFLLLLEKKKINVLQHNQVNNKFT